MRLGRNDVTGRCGSRVIERYMLQSVVPWHTYQGGALPDGLVGLDIGRRLVKALNF